MALLFVLRSLLLSRTEGSRSSIALRRRLQICSPRLDWPDSSVQRRSMRDVDHLRRCVVAVGHLQGIDNGSELVPSESQGHPLIPRIVG